MACDITYKGKTYTHAEFMEMLDNGLLDSFVETNAIDESLAKTLGYDVEETKQETESEAAKEAERPVEDQGAASEAGGRGGGITPPTSTPISAFENRQVRKKIFGRVYDSVTDEDIQRAIEGHGLMREIESQVIATEIADQIINSIGLENAYQQAKTGHINGAVAALIMTRMHAKVRSHLDDMSITEDERADVLAMLIQVTADIDARSVEPGRFINGLKWGYMENPTIWSYDSMVKDWRRDIGEELTSEQEKMFKDLDERYRKAESRIKELEQQKKEWEETQIIAAIKADSEQRAKAKTKAKTADKLIAEGFDELMQALSATKNIVGEAKPSVTKAMSKIGVGLIEKGIATIDNVIEKIKDYLDARGAKADIDTYKDAVKAEIETQIKSKNVTGLKVPKAFLSELIANGYKDMDSLVSAVHKEYPQYSEREIRDAISGYGRELRQTSDDIQKELNGVRREMRLLSQYEDLLKAEEKPFKAPKKKEQTEREMELRQQIKGLIGTLPKSAAEADYILSQAKERTKKRTAILEDRLKNKDFAVKHRETFKGDTELNQLRIEQMEAQFEFDVAKEKAVLNQRSVLHKGLDLAWEIASIPRSILATGEQSYVGLQNRKMLMYYLFSSKPGRLVEPIKKMLTAIGSESAYKKQIHDIHLDADYPLMQDSKLSITEMMTAKTQAREEIGLAYKGITFLWDYVVLAPLWLGSKTANKDIQRFYERAKLFNPPIALERGGGALGNALRVMMFKDGADLLHKAGVDYRTDKKAFKNIADVANTLSGRSDTGIKTETANKIATFLLFSPKWWASTLKYTIGSPIWYLKLGKSDFSSKTKYSPTVAQKMLIKSYMRTFVSTTALMSLAAAYMNLDDDDEWEVITDPTRSDFGKIRHKHVTYDFYGGMIPSIVLANRLLLKTYTSASGAYGGRPRKFGVPYNWKGDYKTPLGVVGEHVLNKLTPTAKLLYAAGTAKKEIRNGEVVYTQYGKDIYSTDELLNNAVPIYWQSMNEMVKEEDPVMLSFIIPAAWFEIVQPGVDFDAPSKQ